jgi:hypothetical protein
MERQPSYESRENQKQSFRAFPRSRFSSVCASNQVRPPSGLSSRTTAVEGMEHHPTLLEYGHSRLRL